MKKWYAVIGDPIAHSMSPDMHDQWFKENGLSASYLPIHIQPEHLASSIESLKLLGCRGWNVTVPHKETIIPYLDRLDASAQTMQAVNTVVVSHEGELIGYNTDGIGFVKSLEEAYGAQCKGKKVMIVGAGGAARGIAFALVAAGYGPVVIANRTLERAEALAGELTNAKAMTLEDAEQNAGEFGLIIQTTSVGMSTTQEGMPFDPRNIRRGTIVADIIHNPLETKFLETASSLGAKTLNGVGMFVHQGAEAFKRWTGIYPNTEHMIQQITNKLGGTHVNR